MHTIRYTHAWLLLVLLVAGCTAASGALRESKRSAERGDWEESSRLLQQALTEKPKDSEIKLQLARARWEASMARLRKGQALLDAGQYGEAITELQVSLSFDPSNLKTLELIQVARKRQDAVHLVQQGHTFVRLNKPIQGREAFEKALALDPQNIEARQALDYYKQEESAVPRLPLKIDSKHPVSLRFKSTPLINVFEVLSRLSGINFIFDNQVKDTKVTLFMTDVPLDRFLDSLLKTNGLAAKAVDDKTVIIYNASPAKTKEYQDLEIRTFYLTHIEAKKVSEMLTKILKSRDVMANEKLNAVVIRGSHPQVELAAKIVEANDRAPAEVMLNVELLEVSRGKEQQLGIEFSESIGVGFGKGSTRGKTGQETKTVTSSSSSGDTRTRTSQQTRTDGSTTSTSGSTRTQGSESGSSQETVTEYTQSVIGGVTSLGGALIGEAGVILDAAKLPTVLNPTVVSVYDLAKLSTKEMLLSLPSATINLLKQDRDTRVLANPQLRVKHSEKASILIGSRIPLRTNRRVDSATGDITNDYQYYDIGVKLEAEPRINLHNEVSLKLSLEVSALGDNLGTIDDPQYAINTRNAQSLLTLRDGEPVILGGLISDEERNTYRTVPLIGEVPILGRLFSNEGSSGTATDVLMIITPVVVRSQDIPSAEVASFWSGSESDFSLRMPYESAAGKRLALRDEPRPDYFSPPAPGRGQSSAVPMTAPATAAPTAAPASPASAASHPDPVRTPAAANASPVIEPPPEATSAPLPLAETAGETAAASEAPPATAAAASPGAETVTPAPQPVAAAAAPAGIETEGQWPDGTRFSLHVGSYLDLAEARRRVAEFSRLGHLSFWIRAQVPGKGLYYRILLGRYATQAEALQALKGLRSQAGFPADSHVVSRSWALGG